MPTLLAKNADVLVTMDAHRRELSGAGLFARDGMIEQVGPSDELPTTADVVLDRQRADRLTRIREHSSSPRPDADSQPARRTELRALPLAASSLPHLARRTPQATRWSTLIGLAELAASGCTTVFDHSYVFPNGCRVDDQIAAAAEIGVRFHACRGSMSLGESQRRIATG